MSALGNHSQFDVAGEPLRNVAPLWRGAMIERYARTEHFVLRSLKCLAQHRIALCDNAFAPLPKVRLNALILALRKNDFEQRQLPALASLEDLQSRWDERNALSHGRFRVGARSVTVIWTAMDKGPVEKNLTLQVTDMLERLAALDTLQRVLGARLGHVDAACKRRAP
ncbi:hypothetical protein GCM10011515_24840 [Tsuneonella deserti]|uniref:RiboL-PSP-HEPN domain-containing protein n=1 Tax=Tsuneonella deserti TaxID=2035528 RepID=A0ABQ1SAT5_9SPHN|nr:hypothetical protein [Tsuneonella deserti]GGE04255.1 hypothetical protein GCM10011515_24840 [Tsuneonella deserti]